MSIISEVDLKEIAEAADLVLSTCRKITELERYIEDLEGSNRGVKVGVTVSGLSSDYHDRGRLYMDLGDPHKEWVIQRLHQMVEEHKFALTQIHPFYTKDEGEKNETQTDTR